MFIAEQMALKRPTPEGSNIYLSGTVMNQDTEDSSEAYSLIISPQIYLS